MIREAARQDGGAHLLSLWKAASPCSGRQGPSPGEGPQCRPLGRGRGAVNRWVERNGGGVQEVRAPVSGEAGLSAGSIMERRRWVGQKGVEGER
jgi:hypothetical protein